MKDCEDNITHHIGTDWYISTHLNYIMRKRILEEEHNNCRLVPTGDEYNNMRISCLSSKISNSRKELKIIQSQLALLSDEDGNRPIHIAVENEDIKQVKKLCQVMSNNYLHLDFTNYMKQTPLHLSVMIGNVDITNLLLRLGASPCLFDRNGSSVLHLAVKSNNTNILYILLMNEQVKNILNLMDYEGYSALHYAVLKNNLSAVKMLHDSGTDMNKTDGKSGRTPLIHAVLEQNASMVDLLLSYDSCPLKTDYSGHSALDIATQTKNVRIMKFLDKWISHNDSSSMKLNQEK